MKRRGIFAFALLSTTCMTPAFAADVPAGTTLADTQTFTYRVLDEFSSFDPQVVELSLIHI